ncbi:MAG: dihydroorotase [Flavobacteriaceae bacterium]|nr:MAG: dihydroorotase [Flavobacteriaceae bacterium]
MNILIKSAIIVDQSCKHHFKKRDVLIEKGIIIKIASKIDETPKTKIISLKNLHLSCGWFDTSVSFGEPGYEERETIKNGLTTAANSGFTAVAVNPNTNPKIDNKAAVQFLINKAAGNITDLYPIGNLTKNADGKDLAELFDMQNFGAIAFGDYNKPISNANLLKIGLQYAQNFDGLVLSFPQDNSIARDGLANEGENSTLLGLKGIPTLAEELQVARDLFLLEYTGGKLHIPTITTATSVKLIKDAKKKGLKVSCSVAAHHLALTDDELHGFNGNTKVTPPLRTKKDIKALQKGIADGTIDIITSDHNPIDLEHKKVEFSSAKFGTIGMESLFGALNKHVDLEQLINSLTKKPRAVFGLEPTNISEGEKANITLFNPDKESIFTEEDILSTSKNSLFINKKMNGKVYGIYNNNQLIINE